MNEPTDKEGDTEFSDFDGYVFDTSFFEEREESGYDEGASAMFRMVRGTGVFPFRKVEIKYLVIYNSHNGYYSHGFDFGRPGEVIQSGSL